MQFLYLLTRRGQQPAEGVVSRTWDELLREVLG
jgi:hypothetical protein